MAELGVGYISIIPETSKIAPGITKALSGVSSGALKTGQSMGSKLASGLATTVTAGAVSAGAAVTGIMGTALVKGFGRLQAVDQAQAKFKGLGFAAQEVSGIMGDVTASVKGTAFSTADAANVAAMAMASGAKPGQELQRTLRLVGDSAAFAGVSFAEMGPVFTEAMSMGKVTGETLAQMRDRGVPAIQALAESLGVSTAEVQSMASQGQISFEQFATAMETYIGGQALASGDTFQGALDNMMAAIGRFGQTLLEPAFASAPPIFTALGGVFDDITAAVEPVVTRVGQALTPALEALAGVIETRLAPAMASGAGQIADLVADLAVAALDPSNWSRYASVFESIGNTARVAGPAVLDLVGAFGRVAGAISVQVWESLASVLEALVPIIDGVLVPVLNQVADVAEKHPGLVQAMVYAWMGMKGVSAVAGPVKSATGFLKGFGEQMKLQKSLAAAGGQSISTVGSAFATLGARLSPLTAKLGAVGTKIGGAFAKVGPVFTKIGAAMKPFVGWIARLAPQLLRFVPIVGAVVAAGTALWAFFTKTETGRRLWDQLMEALKASWAWIKDVFGQVWDWLSEKVSAAWNSISSTVSAAAGWVSDKIGNVVETIKALWDFWTGKSDSQTLAQRLGIREDSTIVTVFTAVRQAAVNLKTALGAAWDWVSAKWQEFAAGFGMFYQTWIQPVVDLFKAAWQTASTVFMTVVDWISAKWQGFAAGFGMFYQTWIQPVVDLFKAAWVGLQPVLQAVWTAISTGFALAGQGIQAVWTSVIQPVWNALTTSAKIIGTVLAGAWEVIKAGFSALGAVISSTWNGVIRPVFDFFRSLVGLVADALTGNFDNIRNRFSSMGQSISNIVTGVINVALQIMRSAVGFAGDAWNAFKTTVSGVVDIVRGKVEEMVDNIKSIPGKIKGFFSDAGNWLKQAGKNIINGLIDGIKSMAGSIGSAIGSIMPDSVFGISIPFAGGGIAMASGGITVESYAAGGRWLPDQARIERPHGARGLVQWAERETGGEAYIPLAPAKRERSTAILAKVADMFGGVLLDRSTGQPMGTGYQGNLGPQAPMKFADGGITAKKLLDFVKGQTPAMRLSLEGAPYVWGGGSSTNWGDCSGTQSMIAGFLAGRWQNQSPRRLFATGSQASVARQLGYTLGRPPAGFSGHAMGWRNGGPAGGHTAGSIFADGQQVNVEMGGGRGNGQIGGAAAAWNDSYFNQFAYRAAPSGTKPYVSQDFGDSTAGMPGAQASASATTPAGPSFGAADSLFKQASAYLGVIADQTVQLAKAAENTSPTAGTTHGSDWNGGGLAADNIKPPADWGPRFFNFEIARQAKKKNLPIDGAKIGIATSLVEAGDPQKMWANKAVPASLSYRHDAVGADHDSVGLFQQRQAGWGTIAQRMSPFESAGLFFDAMLRKFPGWQSMDPGAVAQGVQVSAFPGRYATKMAKALTLVKQTGLYDRGGIIAPGTTLVRNESGKPEAILNNAQWNGVIALATTTARMLDPLREMVKSSRDTARNTSELVTATAARVIAPVSDQVGAQVWAGIAVAGKEGARAAAHWRAVSDALRDKAIAWARGEWPIGSGRDLAWWRKGPDWATVTLDTPLHEVAATNMEIVRQLARHETLAGRDPLARAIYDIFGRTPIQHSLGKIIAAGPDGWRDAASAAVTAFETGDVRGLRRWADDFSQLTHAIYSLREATMAAGQWVANNVMPIVDHLDATRRYAERTAIDVQSIASKGLPAVATTLSLMSDIAVTGTYRPNALFAADSPVTDAAMAVYNAGKTISDAFDEVSTQAWKSGQNLGGEWLAQAQIVTDAEKGLADLRRQLAKDTTDYTEVEKQRREAHQQLKDLGGVGDPTDKQNLITLRNQLQAARQGNDIEEIQARSDALTDASIQVANRLAQGTEEEKKRAEALNKVTEAEEAFTKTRLNQLNIYRKLEAAERTVAAARYTAIADTIKAIADPLIGLGDTAKKFADQVANAAENVNKLRSQLADMRIEQINLQIKTAAAAWNVRVAETDIIRTRLEGAIAVAKAEADLDKAKQGQLQLTSTSVAALAWQIDRFRVNGLTAIGDLGLEMVVNTAAVREAEWALTLARAQADLDEHKALFESTKATFALQQATALQVHTVEVQRLITAQLAQQTQAVAGMSQQAANGFSRWAQGAQQGATGLFGLLGNVATGLASFATGNMAGVVSSVVGGIGNIGSLLMGGNKMRANKEEAQQALAKLPAEQKLGLGLSLLGGAGAAAAGAAASLQFGPEALGWGAQIGGGLVGTAFETATQMLADNLEAVNGRFEDQIAAAKSRYDLDKALADSWMAGQQAIFDAKQAQLDAAISEAKLGVDEAKAAKDNAPDSVLAAYAEAMAAARARREQLGQAQQVHDAAVAAAVAELGKSRQEVNITVEPGMYDATEMADTIAKVMDRVDAVEAKVSVAPRPTARDYLNAKVK